MHRPSLLFHAQKKYAEKIAVSNETEKFSYEEYLLICHRLSLFLQSSLKIKEGDNVLIQLKNSFSYVFLTMSLEMSKAVAVHLNFRFPPKLVEKISQHLLNKHHKTYLISKDCFSRIPGLDIISIEDLKIQSIIENVISLKNKKAEIFRISDKDKQRRLKQITNIIFTSASSGPPKAVVHSYKNHYYSALGSNLNISLSSEDCWLLCLPLCHIGGLSILYRTALKGANIFIPNQDLPIVIRKQKNITHISMVTTQIQQLFKDQIVCESLSRLRAILIGGDNIPPAVVQKASQWNLNLFYSYGSSEMSSQISTTRYTDKNKYFQNCGKPLPFRELKVSPNQEILVRGAVLFKGYFRNGLIQPSLDKEGWFHTKDMGEIDEHGSLRIIGRKDNMFISGGENIHPEEIEEAIMQSGLIEKVKIVPLQYSQDFRHGMRPVAFIEIDPHLSPRPGIKDTLKDIDNLMTRLLPKFKLPVAYFRLPKQEGAEYRREKLIKLAMNKTAVLLYIGSAGTNVKYKKASHHI